MGFPGTHRYDDTLYLLLEGHVVVDKDGDLDISGGELSLAGYPLRIVRFRGPAPDDWVAGAHVEGAAGGDPRAVTVLSYTVEPPSSFLEGDVVEEQPWHGGGADPGLVAMTVSRPDPNTVEIAEGGVVVERRELDALGRVVHVARRLPGTGSTGYVEGDFTHRTAAYDGTGAVVALSEWEAAPNWSFSGQVTLVRSRDPLGMVEEVEQANGSATVRSRLNALYGFGSGGGGCRVLSQAVRPAGGGDDTNEVRRLSFTDALGRVVRLLDDIELSTPMGVGGDHDPWQADAASLVPDGFVVTDREYDAAGMVTEEAVTGLGDPSAPDSIVTQRRTVTYNGLG